MKTNALVFNSKMLSRQSQERRAFMKKTVLRDPWHAKRCRLLAHSNYLQRMQNTSEILWI